MKYKVSFTEHKKADFDSREAMEEAFFLYVQEAFAEVYGCGDGLEFEEDWCDATFNEKVFVRFEEDGITLSDSAEEQDMGSLLPAETLAAWLAHKVWDTEEDIAAHEVRLTGEVAVDFDGAQTNWRKCLVSVDREVYGMASILVFDEPSEYGIEGGRVSKLFVYTPTMPGVCGDELLGYDRCSWSTRPTDSKCEAVLRAVLRRFPVEGGKEAV